MIFSAFYEDSPIGICVLKRDRKDLEVLYCNPQLQKALALSAYEGKTLENIWNSKEAKALAKQLKSPTPPRRATLSFKDNEKNFKRWALINIEEKKFSHNDGSVDCYVLWATDISASKKAEDELEEALEKADSSAEQKSNFLATMSHEIRTPMQSVYGLLELIEQEKPEANILAMSQTAKNSASGLLEILDDILDFAKVDADQMDLDMFEVPLRTLCYGIVEAMEVKVHGKPVDLKTAVNEDVPFVVVGDPKRLRQIIMNLMGNAMKFTHSGSVTIGITKDVQNIEITEGRLGLRFEITDTGIGMSDEAASRLFQPFSQADNSTSRKYGGTGLGLSICKKLVEMMGGQIGVTSIEGKGSTFWFEIPTEEVSTNSTVLDLPDLEGISVLIVEDHPKGRQEIERSLKSMGGIIESCSTCAEAIEIMSKRPFDVAVIDQGLPDGLGLDLIRQAMEIRPHMGIIMYTVRDDAGLQHTLQSLGAVYVSKPASRVGLGEAVLDAASKIQNLTIDGPKKLLIAEDTASIQDVLQRQLNNLGVDADFVENGALALEALKTGKYGLLLTDLHMPELDGYAVIENIRENEGENHFPVIALTADVQMGQRQTYMSYGFDECLLKPVSLGQFKRLLIRWGLLEATSEPENVQTNREKTPSTQSSIDKEAIITQMGALDESTIEMLKMFVDMTEPMIKEISEKAPDDFNSLKELAHSLKGAARSTCAVKLGDMAANLQIKAEEQAQAPELMNEISEEFENVRNEVRAL